MEYVLDFQGTKDENNKFIVKELALISTDGQAYELQLIQPHYDFNQPPESVGNKVIWLENHYGLRWGPGIRYYSDLKDVLQNMNIYGTVLVKGIEKHKFATELMSECNVNVVNIEDWGCPSLKQLKIQSVLRPCTFNHNSKTCAYLNVCKVLEWLKIEKIAAEKMEKLKLAIMECFTKNYNGLQSDLNNCLLKM